MIDKSKHMKDLFGDDTRMYFAIQAAKAVIDSLNPYDNVRTQELRLRLKKNCKVGYIIHLG